MRRRVSKKAVGVLAGSVLFSLACSTVYADVAWEPTPRLPGGPISLYFIALLVIAVIVAAVVIIRSNFKKKGNAQNGTDVKTEMQDKED